ncbi:MAG: hypothetical protein UR67_C0001G0035 [candidate division CPR3 bacterium GW2011_GWF2_35_18]|uniref:Uncharacterized protein n=1 Tax=candidate division CPR3 bacterium GW2011_GWF2_35_18 TaxID=1618350 RepID=A0A0G0C218_UNCC3|nr:MAG: hypothetical protein UR67_C0001G0035 [candidate division CPR3 bacterium GW2011_GWF2_35_18]
MRRLKLEIKRKKKGSGVKKLKLTAKQSDPFKLKKAVMKGGDDYKNQIAR